jgi:hypothetical protein
VTLAPESFNHMPSAIRNTLLRTTVAVALLVAREGSTALAQSGSRVCHLKNPIIAVVPEVWVPGLGHVFIGAGELKRGKVLLGTTIAGGALIVGSQLVAPSGAGDAAARDNILNVGVGVMVASYVFSIVDIIPALVRDRRRCERGDTRVGWNVAPILRPAGVERRGTLNVGASIGIR